MGKNKKSYYPQYRVYRIGPLYLALFSMQTFNQISIDFVASAGLSAFVLVCGHVLSEIVQFLIGCLLQPFPESHNREHTISNRQYIYIYIYVYILFVLHVVLILAFKSMCFYIYLDDLRFGVGFGKQIKMSKHRRKFKI